MSNIHWTVGTVPYLNACPLVDWFHFDGRDRGVCVVDAIPSKLACLINDGEVSIGLVSTLQAILQPDMSTIADIGVAATGPVESVRLFSKCPITSITTIALDHSSNTSNVLLQILMSKAYGKSCDYAHHQPDLSTMTTTADAALLIGDNGYEQVDTFPYVYDLGQEWFDWTGLPFVYAVWTSKDVISSELNELLHQACDWGTQHLEFLALERAAKHRTSVPRALHYFSEVMEYRLTDRHQDGLEQYSRLVMDMASSLVLHQY
jgi:chorismate dehydratase